MKNTIKRTILLTAICAVGFANTLHAQAVYKLTDSQDIDMKLSGTSTLHSWTMNAQTFSSEAQFVLKEHQITALKGLTFSLAVASLKSGESGLDKNAYKALKSTDYKNVSYELTSATVVPMGARKFMVKATGNLTIAGVTKRVNVDVRTVVNADETITCTGSEKLNMTDYGVNPPKFMLGAMKTGDAITLDFTLVYKK